MAKEKMITRTIKSTSVTAFVFDLESCKVNEREYNVPGTYESKKELVLALREMFDNEKESVTAVKAYFVKETLYGMTEKFFMDNAIILPPRGSKEEEEEG